MCTCMYVCMHIIYVHNKYVHACSVCCYSKIYIQQLKVNYNTAAQLQSNIKNLSFGKINISRKGNRYRLFNNKTSTFYY